MRIKVITMNTEKELEDNINIFMNEVDVKFTQTHVNINQAGQIYYTAVLFIEDKKVKK